MKILNLYAGIGGNRKLWSDEHEITAVEWNKDIAEVYKDYFPNDKVLCVDAHQYLLEHYKEFDFIWSSPPCPTHSRFNLPMKTKRYPDMNLYQEIILLSSFFSGKYVVENVRSYYKPLIIPKVVDGHYYWTNFVVSDNKNIRNINAMSTLEMADERLLDLEWLKWKLGKDQAELTVRNCVLPKTGLYILNCAMNIITQENVNQGEFKF